MDHIYPGGVWYNGRYWPPIAGGDGTGDGAGGAGGEGGGGDGAGANGDGGNSGGEGAGGDGGDGKGGAGGSGGSDGGKGNQIVFADTRALGRRLGQERDKTLLATAQEAGFTTVAEFQEHLKAVKEKREKDQGEVTTLRQQVADANRKLEEATTRTQRLALRHAVEVEATKLGFTSPDDAYGLADFGEITFDDDGVPDRKSIVAKLTDLSKAKTYLLTDEARQKAANGANGGSNTQNRSGVGAGAGGSNPPRNGTTQQSGRLGSQITDEKRKELAQRFPYAGFDKPGR